MEALEYIKTRKRICKFYEVIDGGWHTCRYDCPIKIRFDEELDNLDCNEIERKYPETVTELVEIWNKQHPRIIKTNLQKFKEVFPGVSVCNISPEWWEEEYKDAD